MHTRPLYREDMPALQALLMREPAQNVFYLSELREQGLASAPEPYGSPWAVGTFRGQDLSGVVMAARGTGGIYHTPGDVETLEALAEVVFAKSLAGMLSLLSGHTSQMEPLLPLITEIGVGHVDECNFRAIRPGELRPPPVAPDFGAPRLATAADMERLVDFYGIGFYSLAHLPSRAAWRARLAEQLAFRTLYIIEDEEGRVASAAQSSAEGGEAAMLGGVATLPQYRGKGLSPVCVAALCEHLFKGGTATVALFYLKDNDAAGRVYDKLGFGDAGGWLLVPLGFAFTTTW